MVILLLVVFCLYFLVSGLLFKFHMKRAAWETIPERGLTAVLLDSWRFLLDKESSPSVQKRMKGLYLCKNVDRAEGEKEEWNT